MPNAHELPTPALTPEAELAEDPVIAVEAADPSLFGRFKTAADNIVKIVVHGDAIEAMREAANHL